MITAEVDFPAEARDTAIAVIDWDGSHPRLTLLILRVEDSEIVSISQEADKVGIGAHSAARTSSLHS